MNAAPTVTSGSAFSLDHALGTHWATYRFAAYFEKFLALGLAYRPAAAISVATVPPLSEEDALRCMQAQTNAGVTAWMCANDYAGLRGLNYLTAHGVRVPEDVSVTGFDGIQPPVGARAMTTLETPFREIGGTGAGRLLRLVERPFDPTQYILVAGQLRHGETVGPIAKDARGAVNGAVSSIAWKRSPNNEATSASG